VLQEGYGKWKEIMKYAILLYLLLPGALLLPSLLLLLTGVITTSSFRGEAGPELLAAASAERKRQREDGVKLRGGVKKEANKAAVAATEEDEEEANEHSDTDEDKDEANGGAAGKREREKVDYIALGFMRSRLHTLEEALSVEQQLKRLGLLDGKGTASADEYEFSDGDARQGNGQTRETTGENTPTPTSVPSSPLIMSATSDAPSDGSSPMILDAAANSSDESDGDDYTSTHRGPQPGNGDHDTATAATDGMCAPPHYDSSGLVSNKTTVPTPVRNRYRAQLLEHVTE
jgi:hypothetical protein